MSATLETMCMITLLLYGQYVQLATILYPTSSSGTLITR
jgi:hypothetical protein